MFVIESSTYLYNVCVAQVVKAKNKNMYLHEFFCSSSFSIIISENISLMNNFGQLLIAISKKKLHFVRRQRHHLRSSNNSRVQIAK